MANGNAAGLGISEQNGAFQRDSKTPIIVVLVVAVVLVRSKTLLALQLHRHCYASESPNSNETPRRVRRRNILLHLPAPWFSRRSQAKVSYIANYTRCVLTVHALFEFEFVYENSESVNT